VRGGLLGLFLGLLSLGAWAHNFWLQPVPQGARLCLGDGADEEGYQPSSPEQVRAYDDRGHPLDCQQDFVQSRLLLKCPQAAAFSVRADYGTWVKTVRGWHPGSKQEQSERVLKSIWSVHDCKMVRTSAARLRLGLGLEIVLDQVSEQQVRGQVLWQGQPRPQSRLFQGHHQVGRSDDQGGFVVERGELPFLLSTEVEEELKDSPRADHKVTTGTLTLVP